LEVELQDESTLFRGNSITIACYQVFAKIFGTQYLWKTLGQFVTELNSKSEATAKSKRETHGHTSDTKKSLFDADLELEVDPNKMEDGEESFRINRYQLLLTAQKLLQCILDSKTSFPPDIRIILYYVSTIVTRTFPTSKYKALGCFIFLRFIVPAITTPQIYGLLPSPPTDTSQRNLVLLAKVLQNLANNVEFGAKEDHMVKLNDFLTENIENLHQFFDFISSKPDSLIESAITIPIIVESNAIFYLHNYLHENLSKVTSVLDTNPEQDRAISEKLQNVMAQVAKPNTKRSKY